MKIALQISGQIREFKKGYFSLKEKVLDILDNSNIQYDIFASTWSKPENLEYDKIGSWRYPDSGTHSEFDKLFKPIRHFVTPYTQYHDDFFHSVQSSFTTYTKDNGSARFTSQMCQIHLCNELRKKHELENNIKYDKIIRLRSDVEYGKFYLDWLNSDVFLIDQFGNGIGVSGDCWALGKPEDMDIYSSLFLHLEKYHQIGMPLDNEITLHSHMKIFELDYKLITLIKSIYRPENWNLDGLKTEEKNNNNINNIKNNLTDKKN